jgi:hypothetical protein
MLRVIAPADCCSVGVDTELWAKDAVAGLSLVAGASYSESFAPSCVEFSKHFSNSTSSFVNMPILCLKNA